MMLSPHFSLEELTVTEIRGVNNFPLPSILANLVETAKRMEDVRALLAHPILVTSGYRSAEVNRRVGGSPTSAHLQGHAVDFICPRAGTPRDVCQQIEASRIEFDQLISEGNWVHISFAPKMRGDLLTAHFGPKGATYTVGV